VTSSTKYKKDYGRGLEWIMSLYHFLKPVKELPDPNGDLLAIISIATIRETNKEVAIIMEAANGRKESYKKISDSPRARVG